MNRYKDLPWQGPERRSQAQKHWHEHGIKEQRNCSCPENPGASRASQQRILQLNDERVFSGGQPAMPPIAVLGCMIVNRADLTLKMLRSIDYPVDRVVLSHNADTHEETNNEVDKLMEQAQAGTLDLGHKHVKTFITYHHHKNLGFSAGANQIIMGAPDAAYWLIANNDISFRPGSLKEIAKNMADRYDWWAKSCLWGMAGDQLSQYSLFALTPRAVKSVGYFDENFWPAYGEDCDYTIRLMKAKCPMIYEKDAKRLADHHGSASWKSLKSSVSKFVQRGGPTFNNFDYLGAKWGADVCGSRMPDKPFMKSVGYATPFNKTEATVASWKLNTVRRAQIGGPSECLICDSERGTMLQFDSFASNLTNTVSPVGVSAITFEQAPLLFGKGAKGAKGAKGGELNFAI